MRPVDQAAGHEGVLQDASGQLLFKPSCAQEVKFYTDVQGDENLAALAELMPRFLGTLTPGKMIENLNDSEATIVDGTIKIDNDATYIVLENLTNGFYKPSIMDAKLGKVLHDDSASEEKKQRLSAVAAATTSGSLGVRIAGMRVYKDNQPIVYDKQYGRSLTEETFHTSLLDFLGHLTGEHRDYVVSRLYMDLKAIESAIEESEIRMKSASILLVYEADPEAFLQAKQYAETQQEDNQSESSEDSSVSAPKLIAHARIIDFAHSSIAPDQGPDTNVLEGIRTLTAVFDRLIDGEI
ncbi:hypothetical protein CANCADRAFT_137011 [Tortispora caseinolytica NRRL Y-17796]|uniref:Kinase n=1 Tax=Tortispora caseinolytica NRRL Y-17796 TaxID=767744 RepID=A0A1E4TBY8_9ASCO|nr:hypothetical protein CANCADRAFT_137011 [Tortispora caseinolytica NRRL Y-17796]